MLAQQPVTNRQHYDENERYNDQQAFYFRRNRHLAMVLMTAKITLIFHKMTIAVIAARSADQ
jgi:hypothetical protein